MLRPHLDDQTTFEQARAALSARLNERRQEIEGVMLARTFSIDEPSETIDPQYLDGLRAAITAAFEYALQIIEHGEERAPPPPLQLLNQARHAAHAGVGLGTVLRRYSAGYVLLSDFLIEEADQSGLRGPALQRLLRAQSALDSLFAAVSEEYARAQGERPATDEQRRAERIERLLAGEPLNTSGFNYDFKAFHLAAVASGSGTWEALRDLSASLDCRLLAIRRAEDTVWAWFGSRQAVNLKVLQHHVSAQWPPESILAIGEPGRGMSGWRQSHYQARAAVLVVMRGGQSPVRYADVALVASVLQDDVLVSALRQLYLEPLATERDGGKVARDTLRAYLATERNASSAAAALRVSRRTVANRLRRIETTLGLPLATSFAEIEVALRLEDLDIFPENSLESRLNTGSAPPAIRAEP